LARVKFEYFREKLGVLQIEVFLQREMMRPEPSDMVERIGPSMVRCKG